MSAKSKVGVTRHEIQEAAKRLRDLCEESLKEISSLPVTEDQDVEYVSDNLAKEMKDFASKNLTRMNIYTLRSKYDELDQTFRKLKQMKQGKSRAA
jgi:hypothetical protein